jgi:putative ABC transport system permease protein
MKIFLHLYPRAFQEEFGKEWLEWARQTGEKIRAGGKPFPILRLALFLGLDTVRAAPRLWLSPSPEECEARRNSFLFDTLGQDTRFALRTFRRRPLFTVLALGTLALGIGSTTAIFSVVDSVLLRPLAVHAPDELVTVWEVRPGWREQGGFMSRYWDRFFFTYPEYERWAENQTMFQSVALMGFPTMTLQEEDGSERIATGAATASLFPMLGVRPVLGRAFLPGEDGRAAERVALISFAFWQGRFGGDPEVLGESINLGNNDFTVVGVLPPTFRLRSMGDPEDTGDRSVWVPLGADTYFRGGGHNYEAMGRLKPGTTLARATPETAALLTDHADPAEKTVRLVPREDEETASYRTPLYLLLGASLILLLIACANVAALLTGEIPARRHEMATRSALGAGGGRIVRQLLTESLLLGLAGSLLGVLLAVVGTKALIAIAPPLPRLDEVGLSGPVLLFTTALGLGASVLFGLAPSLELSGGRPQESLRKDGRAGGRRRTLFQRSLVPMEVALTLVLLSSGGLLVRSLTSLYAVSPGFNPTDLVEARVEISWNRFADPYEYYPHFRRMQEELEALPGTMAVSGTSSPPFSGPSTTSNLRVVGRMGDEEEGYSVQERMVLPGYFTTAQIPLLAGRPILDTDRSDGPLVAVVSESLARVINPDGSALGARVIRTDTFTVVGIVGDVRHESLEADLRPTFYQPLSQRPVSRVSFLVRSQAHPRGLHSPIRRAIWSIDPAAPIAHVASVLSQMRETAREHEFRTTLMTLFGLCACLLAGAGVFGVTARSVTRRLREIGIRKALGAQDNQLLIGAVGEVMRDASVGIILGLVGSLWMTRFISQFLFSVRSWDPLTYGVVTLGLVVLIGLAATVPARRAASVAPMEVLRRE